MSKKKATKPFDTKRLKPLLSALQKSIRRGLEYQAMYFATELEDMNWRALWNRLRIIASEDISLARPSMPIIIDVLANQYETFRTEDEKKGKKRYRIFLSHAILTLCRSPKSRIADEFLAVVYGSKKEGKKLPIPDYAYDMHTYKGRAILHRGIRQFLRVGAIITNEKKDIKNPYKKRAKQLWAKHKGKI